MASLKLKNTALFQTEALINGKWVASSDGTTFDVINPASGGILAQFPAMTRDQVKDAINAAHTAFASWGSVTPYERQKLLMAWHQAIMSNADDLALIVASENGKPLPEARMEVMYGGTFPAWFAGEAVRTYGQTIPSPFPNTRNHVIKQPLGVAGLITPWNFPVAMVTRKVSAALAAGCTVVLKAPAETPLSATALAVLAEQVGFPSGVFNVVTMAKGQKEQAAGLELCENPLVKKISFTGSTPVGRLLMKQSSATLKKLSLELGGNAAFIVFEDADLDVAANAIIAAKFRGSGQTCIVANRIFVHASIAEALLGKLETLISKMKVGNPIEQGVSMGPMISEAGMQKVERHIQDAVDAGAKLVLGGKRLPGPKGSKFFAPTLLSKLPADCLIQNEETFGPVAALFEFADEPEVIKRANGVEVGLAGYFFTKDLSRAHRVSEKLEVGMVAINTAVIAQASIPFGGIKQSGFGKEGGPTGINEFMFDKLICTAI